MEITDKTIDQLSNLNLETEDEEEIEVIYVENLTGIEIVEFARYGELQIMDELLRLGLLHKLKEAMDERGNTALHMASANGHREVVEFILMAVADDVAFINKVNEKGNTALHWACLNGHSEVADLLLRHGADHTVHVNFSISDFY
jgi:ankyrin repeat protein